MADRDDPASPGASALLLGVLDYSENIQLWQIYSVTFLIAALVVRRNQLQIIRWQSRGSFFIKPLITWPRSM